MNRKRVGFTTFQLITFVVIAIFLINFQPIMPLNPPEYFGYGISVVLLIGCVSLLMDLRLSGFLFIVGAALFLFFGVLSSIPSQDDLYYIARKGINKPIVLEEIFMYIRIIIVSVNFLLLLYSFKKLRCAAYIGKVEVE